MDEKLGLGLEDRLFGRRASRRAALRGGLLVAAGLSAAALVGCGDDDDDDDDDETPAAGGTAVAGTSTPAGGSGEATPVGGADQALIDAQNALAEADGAPFPYAYADPPGEPKSGGVYVAHQSAFSTLDPNNSQSLVTLSVPNVAGNRLLGSVVGPTMDKTKFDLAPELATEWEVAADGLTYTFKLRDDVKFHNVAPVNGRALTASDVVAVYERSREGVSGSLLADVDSITAPDDHTVVFTQKSPNADFLIPLATRLYPIYPMEIVDQSLIDTTAVGTGPMILTDFDPSTSAKFDANPDYWDGAPYLDGFEFRILPDEAARVAAFRAGQIYYQAPASASEAKRLDETGQGAILSSDPAVIIAANVWGFNPDNPKFTDDRVRQALSMALDRQRMIDILYEGYGKAVLAHGWTFVFDHHPTTEEFGPWWAYNPTEATKLLAAAGQEGLEFGGISGVPQNESGYSLAIDMWREIGVQVSFQIVPYPEHVEAIANKTYPDSHILTPLGTYPAANSMYYDYMHSETNYWRINDPDVDAWAEQQRSEFDPDARRELLRKQWDRVQDRVFKIETVEKFWINALNPSVRFMRWNGPYYNNFQSYDYGKYLAKTWLDQ